MQFRLFCLALAVSTLVLPGRLASAQEQFPFQIFERYLNQLIPHIGMPGLSAAILQNGSVVWEYNYGFADVERKIWARSDTPYPVGGITQAVTGVLLGVCIDRFGFNIHEDIKLSYPAFPVGDTSTRQVLSHSTGGRYRYDPTLFTLLTPVVESRRCLNEPYRKAMAVEVLDRLGMTRSVPGLDLNRPEGAGARALFDASAVTRYQSLLSDVAVPYRIDGRGNSTRSDYPSYSLDAATGLVSTVDDLARFEGQLDRRNGHPVSLSTLEQMWSNQIFTIKDVQIAMPTGLGWFVTTESGQRLVWTFGHIPDAGSALIVKMTKPAVAGSPEQRLTLIMLANSSGLAKGYDLENAQVTSSPFVKVFLRLFI
jgi:CubicO group peptidase (beta-lactamase class C family)